MILETIANNYLWFLVAILVINMYQRKHVPRSNNKRIATLIIASLAMLWQVFIVIIITRGWPHYLAVPALALTVAIAYPFRKRILLFRNTCAQCGVKLNFTQIVNFDDNLCDECYAKEHPETISDEKEAIEPEETIVTPSQYTDVQQIDWDEWEPTEVAVLTYLFVDDQVLLIHKKTGLGKGLINAPGGHIEEGETADEAAMREITEETGLSVPSVTYKGRLDFQFTDGLKMRGYIFFAGEYEGELIETDEALPFWCKVDELPYDKMWEDDVLWLPPAIKGMRVNGCFIFDGEKMLSHQIETIDDTEEE
ncbi:MAG: 8-oxo-dGTP diphosphatase [Sphaerochaetaceae bacterium]|nr:8-oxo-dGTP diphosphatase [Sphaerochaetaceae bacterium]